ncbi:MAG: efflux RND transporter periplasmic adaptor subunit [bacterium]|nr:MAG: efflux RND transporter periplasmic adaptor subunit [bacterium]
MHKLKMMIFLTVLIVSGVYFAGCGSKPESESNEHETSELSSSETNNGSQEHSAEEHAEEIEIKPEVMEEVGIEIVAVSRRKFNQIKTYPGKVVARPDGEALVGSLVGGRVVEIHVGLGDRVLKGSTLCNIESPEIGAAQAAYIRALAQYNLAQKDLDRHQKLFSEKIGSEKTLIEKEALEQSARAELAASERALHSLGFLESEVKNLMSNHSTSGMLTLKSPIAGTVTDWSIQLGQRVDSEENLFHIVDLSRLWIQIALYEKDLAYIRNNQSVDIIPQSLSGVNFQGKIVRIGREVKGETRTIDCYVEVANPDEILIPNLFVTCRVQIGSDGEEVLAVPEDAIIIDQHSDRAVYVEHEPQRFVVREVEIGRSSSGWIEVVDGLKEGDRVVFKGAFFIKSEVAKGSFGHGHEH